MASVFGDQDEIFHASSGKNNFIRVVRLLLSVGTVIIRELFDSIYPPDDLATVLKTPLIEQHLKNLRKQKILSETQWNVLFPTSHMSTRGKSESFDITLLFKLIRELVILIPPVPEWGYLPVDTDLSLPADLAKIELYRNNVYANGYERMELTDDEFKDYWKQIRDALIRIVNHYSSCSTDPASAVTPWQTTIDELIEVSITEEDEHRVVEELKSWYLQDVEHKQMNNTTKEKLRINTEEMASKIDQNKSPEVTLQCTFKLSQRAWVVGTAYIIVQYKDAPEKLVNNIKEALPLGMVVSTIVAGSIKIVLQSKTLLSMDYLLKRYKAGQLEEKLEKAFVTEDLKELANGEEITFSVEMSQRDYTRATDYCQPLINSKRKSKAVELDDSFETGDQNENMESNHLKELKVKRVTDKITETEAKKKVQMKMMNIEEWKVEEAFCCSEKGVRRYILEHRKDELVKIEKQHLVKIEAGETEKEFLITGRKTKFTVARKALDILTSSVEMIEMRAEQPGLHKFFASGRGDRLVKAVENEHQCAIETLENGSRKTKTVPSKEFQEESLDTSASIEKDDEVAATGLVCSSSSSSFPSNVSAEESQENDMAEQVDKMSFTSGITSSQASSVAQKSEEPNLQRGGLRSSIPKIMKKFFGRQSRTITTTFGKVSVQVVHGDFVQEQTDAIVNINSTQMNMQNAGALSKAVAAAAGPAVQLELNRLGCQTPGSVVVTGAGKLKVRYIIHMIPGSSNTAILESCIKKCLRYADEYKFQSLSMPAFGTGNIYNLPAKTSAEATFQAIAHVCPDLKNLQEIRLVIFQKGMLSAFKQTQQRYGSRTSKQSEFKASKACKTTKASSVSKMSASWQHAESVKLAKEKETGELSANRSQMLFTTSKNSKSGNVDKAVKTIEFRLFGKNKDGVDRAKTELTKGLAEECKTQTVENKDVSKLSERQRTKLRTKARDLDVAIEFQDKIQRIVVRGDPGDVCSIINDIWEEIYERSRIENENEKAEALYKLIKWRYELHGVTDFVNKSSDTVIEKAHANKDTEVTVEVEGEKYLIDLAKSTGTGFSTGQTISVMRTTVNEGNDLPTEWCPMPMDNNGKEKMVHLVQLEQSSDEYQKVFNMFKSTGGRGQILRIERIQNPYLYQLYMVCKAKMDKDNGGMENERQLFHGTAEKNLIDINAKGFHRSFCGENVGTKHGKGVYFATKASYSTNYTKPDANNNRYMYLARVLVGRYAKGHPGMKKPPETFDSVADTTGPKASVFVVFYDRQCYPEYLIAYKYP